MKNKNFIESSLEKIGRSLARRYNIQIIFEGSRAYTDGKKIVLPSFKNLDEEMIKDLNGYLDHEVAHCKFTTFPEISKTINQFHKNLFNAVEDIRIERLMKKEFYGSTFNLNPLREKVTLENMAHIEKMPWPIKLMFVIQDRMNGGDAPISEDIKYYWDLVQEEFVQLNDCTSTKELRVLTETITNKIINDIKNEDKEEDKNNKESEDSGSGDEESESEENESNESNENEDSDKRSEECDKDNSFVDASEGDSDDESLSKEEVLELMDDEEEWEEHSIDVHDFINKEIEEKLDERDGVHTAFSTRYDTVTDFTGRGDKNKYLILKKSVNSLINKTKNGLEKILKIQENAKFKFERERGTINSRDLSKLASNKNYKTPFREFSKKETTNVAIQILIDMSGSMSNAGKMKLAKKSIVAMSEALNSLNIKFEVTGFHSIFSQELHRTDGNHYSFNRRNEKLDHYIFKNFNSNNLVGIEKIFIGANNVDGESVRWASSRLFEQKEKRKILFVFSDGSPAAEGSTRILQKDLVESVESVIKSGIECVGFGINTEAVEKFYPDHIVINEISDLPNIVMSKLSNILLKNFR